LVAGWGSQAALKRIQNQQVQQGGGGSGSGSNSGLPAVRNILKEVDMELVDGNACQEVLRRNVGDSQFILDKRSFVCAGGEPGKGLCRVRRRRLRRVFIVG
jgi:hypothetical protein